MYSSIDRPTTEQWAEEAERLLNTINRQLSDYAEKIEKELNKKDCGIVRVYCLKLLEASKRLEFAKCVLDKSEVE